MADTRNRGNVSESRLNEDASKALREIFSDASHKKEIPFDAEVLSSLRKKLGDDKVVDAAYDYYKKRLEQIKEKATKFKNALFRKYAGMSENIDTRALVEKARKYTKKYDLTDSEFTMFMKLLMTDKTQASWNIYNIPSTPMSRTLGYSSVVMGDKLNVSDSEMGDLKIILEKDKEYDQLHKQLILQTLVYKDMQIQSLIGKYNPQYNNAYKHVHPVLAALFLPKNAYLEQRMLLSSIAGIVKTKNDGRPITTVYDYETYWDIITDPNQTACVVDNTKTVADLKNRVLLQVKLWEAVMNLRNGRYYADNSDDFMTCIEHCSNSIFDAPDMVYTQDEGTVLRRLMNAFSLRPTCINTSYMSGMPMGGNFGMVPTRYSHTTTLPLVTLRIPPKQSGVNVTIKITDAINQPQWFLEGKTLVPRTIQIAFSRDVLFYYVNRRSKSVNYGFQNKPYIFNAFPMTHSGLDKLNDSTVIADSDIGIEGESYKLRSVVCSMITHIGEAESAVNVITGCASILIPNDDSAQGKTYLYFPRGADSYYEFLDGQGKQHYRSMTPVTILTEPTGPLSFEQMSAKQGSIYIYHKIN
jgi:hypothetical protein